MATYEGVKTKTMLAGEALNGGSIQLGMAVKAVRHVATKRARVQLADSATDVVIGVLLSKPNVATLGVSVTIGLINGSGKLTGLAGGAISAGEILIPTATDGEMEGVANIAALAANQMGFGIAEEDAVDGQIFEFLPMFVAGPTA